MTLHPILQALGWALLHFLWQGAALALLLLAVQGLMRTASASARYAAACIAMLLMPICFVATIAMELPHAPTPVIENRLTADLPLHPVKQVANAPVTPFLPVQTATPALPDWIAALWLLGVASMSLYTLVSLGRVRRLKTQILEPIDFAGFNALLKRLKISRPVNVCSSALAQVPAVAGWLRPVILLPVTALTGLTDSQIEAILAHELAHIRRHDYLVNLFQTAVETLLFYHPATWWISRQIRMERENCCDDIAVSVCGDPIEYASALAEMEEIRGRFPEPALAATGGDLLSRVRRLLGEPESPSLSLGRIGATALAVLILGASTLLSQQAKPAFEVASIKPNNSVPEAGYYFRMMGVSPSMTNQTLRNIIMWAYEVRDFQVTGGPNWIASDRYDVQAKTAANAGIEKMRLMVQTLLEDRFKLALHREVKEVPIFELTVVKSGLKVQPIKAGDCIAHEPGKPAEPPPGKTFMDMCGTSGFGRGSLLTSSATMTEVAQMLSSAVGRTVVDKTGITGQFRINLTFAPENTSTAQNGGPPPPSTDAPSIYTALQEQLGLKLDSAKGPVEVLVIDHAEKPSDN